MSRLRLAKAIGFAVGPDAIEKYEKGTHSPLLDTAILLAQALKIPLKKLTDAKG